MIALVAAVVALLYAVFYLLSEHPDPLAKFPFVWGIIGGVLALAHMAMVSHADCAGTTQVPDERESSRPGR